MIREACRRPHRPSLRGIARAAVAGNVADHGFGVSASLRPERPAVSSPAGRFFRGQTDTNSGDSRPLKLTDFREIIDSKDENPRVSTARASASGAAFSTRSKTGIRFREEEPIKQNLEQPTWSDRMR
ncbi:hypothetical protein [Blastochloris viridis]|uniref:hypothetical protein n=1 Tax=Blastochloris viridis TaxID=1079 RepID=UPI0011A5235A|nr:hypothetical protein [Blastochloris viridis]